MQKLPPHISAFTESDFYPHDTGEIIMLQTHISWVFLAGGFAYKVKKPVNLGFLDFSSLQARHQACLKELKLNRRMAPDIYLNVLPISRGDDRYLLDSGTPPVEYCLQMVRFDQRDMFSHLVASDRFNPIWMDSLAERIASFHQSAETSQTDARRLLAEHIEDNLEVAESHPQSGFEAEQLNLLKTNSRRQLEELAPQLALRQQRGYVRDCHGDLHLNNIVLFNGKPTPFDCIEFNDAFSSIDTMNDIAFLVMDCDASGRPELGLRFLSRYLERTGDYEGLQLLPLYLSYRAGVRAKVACLLADDRGIENSEQQKQLNDAHNYLQLAANYLHPARPKLFAVGGLSGSGKSHLALLGMQQEHAIVIRTDATRKRIALDHPQLPLYGDVMHKLTYRMMFEAASICLQAGFSVILDATFLHPGARMEVEALSKRLNVPCRFYWLDIAPETLRARIISRTESRSDISDADQEVLERQLANHLPPAETFVYYLYDSNDWPARPV